MEIIKNVSPNQCNRKKKKKKILFAGESCPYPRYHLCDILSETGCNRFKKHLPLNFVKVVNSMGSELFFFFFLSKAKKYCSYKNWVTSYF